MSKRKRLVLNVMLGFILAVLTAMVVIIYINYYPRVTIYFIDQYEILDSVELKKGNSLPQLPVPEKIGSSFEGWYTDDTVETPYNPNTAVNSNTELFAKFEKIPYSLSYVVDGYTNLYASSICYYSDLITLPTGTEALTLPSGQIIYLNNYKPGYDFVGWTTAQDGSGTIYYTNEQFSMLAQNTTLYAKWVPQSYNVTFKTVQYDSPDSILFYSVYNYVTSSFDYLSYPTAPSTNPERVNYTFVGWYYDEALTLPVDWDNVVMGVDGVLQNKDGDILSSSPEFFGKFSVITYVMSYDLNAPSATITILNDSVNLPVDQSVYYGKVVAIYNGSVLKGVSALNTSELLYKFAGWNTERDGSGTSYPSGDNKVFDVKNNVVLFAQWARYYTLTYQNGTSELSGYTTKFVQNETINLPDRLVNYDTQTQITRTGYYFAGWTEYDSDTLLNGEFTLADARDYVLYAKWEKQSYVIRFALDGGNVVEGVDLSDVTKIYLETVILPSATNSASRSNYQMHGWIIVGINGLDNVEIAETTNSFKINESMVGYASLNQGKYIITLKPNWKEEAIVAFDLNGGVGTTPGAQIKLKTETFTMPTGDLFSRQYYTFKGWSTVSTDASASYIARRQYSFSANSTILYAVWSPNQYTIEIYNVGTSGVASEKLNTITFDVENPVQLYVKVATSVTDSGLQMSIPNGYTFVGLTATKANANISADYLDSATPYTYTVEDVPVGTTVVKLYTVLSRDEYTIRYLVDGEDYITAQTKYYGDTISMPSNPVKEGHTFVNWYCDDVVVLNGQVITSNMELVAVFEKITYSVKLIYNSPTGGKDTAYNTTQSGEYGDLLEQSTINVATAKLPAITGYVFAGWYVRQTPLVTDEALQAGLVIDGNYIYYSYYKAVSVNVTYTANGGTGDNMISVVTYDSATLLPNATSTGFLYNGYKLVGWSLTPSNSSESDYIGNVDASITSKFSTNTTVYAVWKKLYTLSFVVDEEGAQTVNLPSATQYVDGSTYTIPNNIRITSTQGKTYAGVWVDQSTIGGTEVYYSANDTITITGDLVLVAVAGVQSLTVTYKYEDVNNAGSYYKLDEQTISYGGVLTLPNANDYLDAISTNAPSYIIDGWMNTSGEMITGNQTITSNTTYLLKLTKYYTITYDANGGIGSVAKTTYIPNRQTSLSTSTYSKTGFSFLGWSLVSSSATATYTSGQEITLSSTSNIVLYAIWEEGGVTVVFNINNGTSTSAELTGKYNGTITLPSASAISFAYTNYRLTGWYGDAELSTLVGTVGEILTLSFTETKQLYAKWEREYEVVYYKSVDDTTGNTLSTKYLVGETLTLSNPTDFGSSFTITGKDFSNWTIVSTYYSKGSNVAVSTDLVTDGIIKIYANWTDIKYTVTRYRTNPESGVSTLIGSTEVIYGGTYSGIPSLSNLTNYEFVGWNTKLDGTGTTYSTEITNILQNINLYSMWVRTYIVTYSDGSGQSVNISYKVNSTIVADNGNLPAGTQTFSTTFSRTGYTLVGYVSNSTNYRINTLKAYSNGWQTTYTVTGVDTLTAIWAQNRTITLHANYGVDNLSTIGGVIDYDTIDLSTYMSAFTRENFVISGWSETSNGSSVTSYTVSGDDDLYAIWTGAPLVVTFSVEGNTYTTKNVIAGNSVTAPSDPAKSKYYFVGWYDGATQWDFSNTIETNKTLSAVFKKLYYVNYELGLKDDQGETYTGSLPTTAASYKAGNTIDLTTTIDRSGYSFVSWKVYYGEILKLSGQTSTITLTDLIVDESDDEHTLNIVAVWSAKTFTLTVSNNVYATLRGNMTLNTNTITSASLNVYYDTVITISGNSMTFTNVSGSQQTLNIVEIGSNEFKGFATLNGEKDEDPSHYNIISTFTMPSENYNLYVIITEGKLTTNYTITGGDTNLTYFIVGGQNVGSTYSQDIPTSGSGNTVTIVPGYGYKVDGWYIAGVKKSSSKSFQVSGYTSDVAVSCVVVKDSFNVSFTIIPPEVYTTTTTITYVVGGVSHIIASGTSVTLDYLSDIQFNVDLLNLYRLVSYTVAYASNTETVNATYSSISGTYADLTVVGNTTITFVLGKADSIVTFSNVEGTTTYATVPASYGVAFGEISVTNPSDIITSNPYTGYRFVGWYKDTGYLQPFTSATVVTSDITVYAKFDKLYQITFDTLSGTGCPSTQYVLSSDTITLTPTPAKSNYHYLNWSMAINGNTYSTTNETVVLDSFVSGSDLNNTGVFTAVVTAVYEKIYSVLFVNATDTETGTLPVNNINALTGNTIDLTNTIRNTGYTLTGWSVQYGSETPYTINGATTPLILGSNIILRSDEVFTITIKPIWTINTYTLTIENTNAVRGTLTHSTTFTTKDFVVNYSTIVSISSGSISFTDSLGTLVTISVATIGTYTFLGWSLDDNTTYIASATTTTPASDATLKANFGKGTSKLTVSIVPSVGGTLSYVDTDPVQDKGTSFTDYVDTGDDTHTIKLTASNGYEIVGWYVNGTLNTADLLDSGLAIKLSNVVVNTTIELRMQKKTYAVTVVTTVPSGATQTRGTFTYTINGDSATLTSGNMDNTVNFNTLYQNNLLFTIIPTSQYFSYNGLTYSYTTDHESTAVVVNKTATETISFAINGPTTITINLDYRTYTVSYVTKDKVTAEYTQYIKYGSSITTIPNAIEDIVVSEGSNYEGFEGYKFVNWYTDSNCTSLLSTGYSVTSNVTIYSKWEKLYRVQFTSSVGTPTLHAEQYVVASDVVDLSTKPTLAGYVFNGYTATYATQTYNILSTASSFSVGSAFSSYVSDSNYNVKLTANWVYAQYTTTLNTNDAQMGKVGSGTNTYSSTSQNVKYKDYIIVSDKDISIYHDNDELNAKYSAVINDESWEFVRWQISTDGGLNWTTLTATKYTVGTWEGLTVVMQAVFKAGNLTAKYTILSDYTPAFSSANTIAFTFYGNSENYCSVVVGEHVYTSNIQLSLENGATFSVIVPRNSTDSYVDMVVTCSTGYYISKIGASSVTQNQYTRSFKNILTNSTLDLGFKLSLYSFGLSVNDSSFGQFSYSYTTYKTGSNGYIINEVNQNINSTTTSANLTNIPANTIVTLNQSANGGRTFSKWVINDVDNTTSGAIQFSIIKDSSATLVFTQNNYTYRFVLPGSSNVEVTALSNIHTGDDITSLITGVANLTEAQMNDKGFTNKWFESWNISALYSGGKIIAGVGDVIISATLSDAYNVRLQVQLNNTDATHIVGTVSVTTGSATNFYCISNSSYNYIMKIKSGTPLPNILAVASTGYKFVLYTITNTGETISNTQIAGKTLSGISAGTQVRINVNFTEKEYTVNYYQSNNTTVYQSLAGKYGSNILSLISTYGNPTHLDSANLSKYYEFDHWSTSISGTAISSSYTIDGTLNDGASISIYSVFNITQKYHVVVYNADHTTKMVDSYYFSSDIVNLTEGSKVDNKQFVYFAPSSSDNGNATNLTGYYYIMYIYSGEVREKLSSTQATQITVGTSDITLYATYVNTYTLLFKSNPTNNTTEYCAGTTNFTQTATVVDSSMFSFSVVSSIFADKSIHYRLDNWNVQDSTTTYATSENVKITQSLTLVANWTLTSLKVTVYNNLPNAPQPTALSYVTLVVTNNAINWYYENNGYKSALPYYNYENAWKFVTTLPAGWVVEGYNFVGYTLGTSTYSTSNFYNLTNIGNIKTSTSDLVLYCQWSADNISLTIKAIVDSINSTALPKLNSIETKIYVTYDTNKDTTTQPTSLLRTTSYSVSPNTTIMVAYGYVISFSIVAGANVIYNGITDTSNLNTSYSGETVSGTNPNFHITAEKTVTFSFSTRQLTLTLMDPNYLYSSAQGTYNGTLGTYKLDGSNVSSANLIFPYGSIVSNSSTGSWTSDMHFTISSCPIWNGASYSTSTSHTITYVINSGLYYTAGFVPVLSYSGNENTVTSWPSGSITITDSSVKIAVSVGRISWAEYDLNTGSGTTTPKLNNSQSPSGFTVIYNNTTFALSDITPLRDGYSFTGWNIYAGTSSSHSGSVLATIPTNISYYTFSFCNGTTPSGIVLVAQWSAIPISIQVVFNGSTSLNTTYLFDTNYTISSSIGTQAVDSGSGSHGSFGITINGTSVYQAGIPAGYYISGVSSSPSCNLNGVNNLTTAITFTITITIHTYKVVYVMNDNNSSVVTSYVTYGNSISLPQQASHRPYYQTDVVNYDNLVFNGTTYYKTNYMFTGWSTTSGFSGAQVSSYTQTITIPMVYYATWTQKFQVVMFYYTGSNANVGTFTGMVQVSDTDSLGYQTVKSLCFRAGVGETITLSYSIDPAVYSTLNSKTYYISAVKSIGTTTGTQTYTLSYVSGGVLNTSALRKAISWTGEGETHVYADLYFGNIQLTLNANDNSGRSTVYSSASYAVGQTISGFSSVGWTLNYYTLNRWSIAANSIISNTSDNTTNFVTSSTTTVSKDLLDRSYSNSGKLAYYAVWKINSSYGSEAYHVISGSTWLGVTSSWASNGSNVVKCVIPMWPASAFTSSPSGSKITSTANTSIYSNNSITSIVVGPTITSIGASYTWSTFVNGTCTALRTLSTALAIFETDNYGYFVAICDNLILGEFDGEVLDVIAISSDVTSIEIEDNGSNHVSMYIAAFTGGQTPCSEDFDNTLNQISFTSLCAYRVSNLDEIYLHPDDGTIYYYPYAFAQTPGLTSLSLVNVPEGLCANTSQVKSPLSLSVPKSYSAIGDYAFYNRTLNSPCSGRYDYSTGYLSNATSIGACAFYNSFDWGNNQDYEGVPLYITIPSSVTSIGSYAFNSITSNGRMPGCATIINFLPSSISSFAPTAFDTFDATYAEVHFIAGYSSYYMSALSNKFSSISYSPYSIFYYLECNPSCFTWSGTIITGTVGTCTPSTAYNFQNNMVLPRFNSSGNLTTQITNLGAYSSSINTMIIPKGIALGDGSNSMCTSLTTTIGGISEPIGATNSTTNNSIYAYAFSNTPYLTGSISISFVTAIYNHAFYNCTGIQHLTFINATTIAPYYMFYNCSALETVYLRVGSSTTMVAGSEFSYMFQNCSQLTTVTIGAFSTTNTTNCSYYMFSGCSLLTQFGTTAGVIDVPANLTYMDNYTFNSLYNVRINIPSTVTTIATNAIVNCGSSSGIVKVYNYTTNPKTVFKNAIFGTGTSTSAASPYVHYYLTDARLYAYTQIYINSSSNYNYTGGLKYGILGDNIYLNGVNYPHNTYYRPFRPKRKTRASVAIAKGLQPLADKIMAQSSFSLDEEAAKYISEEKGVKNIEEAVVVDPIPTFDYVLTPFHYSTTYASNSSSPAYCPVCDKQVYVCNSHTEQHLGILGSSLGDDLTITNIYDGLRSGASCKGGYNRLGLDIAIDPIEGVTINYYCYCCGFKIAYNYTPGTGIQIYGDKGTYLLYASSGTITDTTMPGSSYYSSSALSSSYIKSY